MQDSIVKNKSYKFAIRIINLYKYLTKNKKEFVLSKQILRSGTSIGANVEESLGGKSTKDFLSKLSVAYKETRETKYWLNLLKDSQYLNETESKSLLLDCEELLRIIGKIQITLKKRRLTRNCQLVTLNCSSISISLLYFSTLSPLVGPHLMYSAPTATAKSTIKVSLVSPPPR